MPAPKGNKFWEKRSKHGRDKIFVTPTILLDAACEYFTWCEDNPLMSVEYAGGKRVRIPKMRALTIHGLCIFLGVNTTYFNDFKSALKEQDTETNKDFSQVIKKIEDIIYNQKFEGAAAGFLNANIIARDLGLADKTKADLTTNGESINKSPDLTHLTFEQLKELKYGKDTNT